MKPSAPKTRKEFIQRLDEIATEKIRIDSIKRMGLAQGLDMKVNHARPMEEVFEALQRDHPVQTMTMPSGVQYQGTQLPKGWADAQVLIPRLPRFAAGKRGSLLHLASELGAKPKWIRWLVASGVDPLKFCEDIGSAPLGYMAYWGNHQAIRVLRRAGFDLSLRLEKNHLNMSHTGQASLLGSTLLQRVASRFSPSRQHEQVIYELIKSGLCPSQPRADGETAISLCRDPVMKHHLEKVVAKKTAKAMSQATPTAPANTSSVVKRL